jgi:hypothetical protein
VVLAGGPDEPHNWFASRAGDPFDWDFSGLGGHLIGGGGVGGTGLLDPNRPIDGTTAPLGKIGEPITALVPHSKDYLVVGATRSLWRLVNLGLDVYAINLSRQVGIQSGGSWTHGSKGELVFLSRDGLYALGPEADSDPISLSRDKIPRELLELDPDVEQARLIFDLDGRGVYIFIDHVAQTKTHWWFDMETGGFWPFNLPSTHKPGAVAYKRTKTAGIFDPGVIVGGQDGHIRIFDRTSGADDSIPIESRITYGPVNLGGSDTREGLVSELQMNVIPFGSTVSWEVLTGDSAAKAIASVARASGSVGPDLRTYRPRIRGNSAYLRLSSSGLWEVESVVMTTTSAGRARSAS